MAIAGLLRDKTISISPTNFSVSGTTTKMTDNDESTSYAYNELSGIYAFYEFPSAVTLTGYALSGTNLNTAFLRVQKSDDSIVDIVTSIVADGAKQSFPDVADVKKIIFYFRSGSENIQEFEVYGPTPKQYKYLVKDGEDIKSFSDSWTIIGQAPATEDMFLTSGMDSVSLVTANAWKQLGSTFSVLEYVNTKEPEETSLTVSYEDKSVIKRTATLTAVPHPQLLVTNANLTVEELASIKATTTLSGAGVLRIIASGDSGASWKAKADITLADLAGIKANGWTPAEFNALTREQLASLFPNGKVQAGFYFEQNATTDVASIESLSVVELEYKFSPSLIDAHILYDTLVSEEPTFYVSRNDGVDWIEVSLDEMSKLDSLPEGKDLRVKVELQNGLELHGISFSWI